MKRLLRLSQCVKNKIGACLSTDKKTLYQACSRLSSLRRTPGGKKKIRTNPEAEGDCCDTMYKNPSLFD